MSLLHSQHGRVSRTRSFYEAQAQAQAQASNSSMASFGSQASSHRAHHTSHIAGVYSTSVQPAVALHQAALLDAAGREKARDAPAATSTRQTRDSGQARDSRTPNRLPSTVVSPRLRSRTRIVSQERGELDEEVAEGSLQAELRRRGLEGGETSGLARNASGESLSRPFVPHVLLARRESDHTKSHRSAERQSQPMHSSENRRAAVERAERIFENAARLSDPDSPDSPQHSSHRRPQIPSTHQIPSSPSTASPVKRKRSEPQPILDLKKQRRHEPYVEYSTTLNDTQYLAPSPTLSQTSTLLGPGDETRFVEDHLRYTSPKRAYNPVSSVPSIPQDTPRRPRIQHETIPPLSKPNSSWLSVFVWLCLWPVNLLLDLASRRGFWKFLTSTVLFFTLLSPFITPLQILSSLFNTVSDPFPYTSSKISDDALLSRLVRLENRLADLGETSRAEGQATYQPLLLRIQQLEDQLRNDPLKTAYEVLNTNVGEVSQRIDQLDSSHQIRLRDAEQHAQAEWQERWKLMKNTFLAKSDTMASPDWAQFFEVHKKDLQDAITEQVRTGMMIHRNEISTEHEALFETLRNTQYNEAQSLREEFKQELALQLSVATPSDSESFQTNIESMRRIIQSMIDESLRKFSADVLARPDYALFTSGARVISSLTSPTYTVREGNWLDRAWSTLRAEAPTKGRPPVTVLHPSIQPGMCWPFEGRQGQIGIKLVDKIQVSDVTIEHTPKALLSDTSSAPKQVQFVGIVNDKGSLERMSTYKRAHASNSILSPHQIELGNFVYNLTSSDHIQTFSIAKDIRDLELPIEAIIAKVKDNWGAPLTCLYRIRVHGKRIKS